HLLLEQTLNPSRPVSASMQVPMKKLLALLGPDQPADVRAATALVLGELGGREAEVNRALGERLADDQAAVRLQAIKAVGKLRVESALPALLERIREGGDE